MGEAAPPDEEAAGRKYTLPWRSDKISCFNVRFSSGVDCDWAPSSKAASPSGVVLMYWFLFFIHIMGWCEGV